MVRMSTLRLSRRQILNALGTTAAFGVVPRASHVAHAAPAPDAAGQASSSPASAGSLTDVAGIRVGHFTDTRRPTGCTVVLFDKPATAGADYDGSAPGESLGVMLQPVSPLERIHRGRRRPRIARDVRRSRDPQQRRGVGSAQLPQDDAGGHHQRQPCPPVEMGRQSLRAQFQCRHVRLVDLTRPGVRAGGPSNRQESAAL